MHRCGNDLWADEINRSSDRHSFKRLRLKGLAKVDVEIGLACIAII
ncbi:hypothetical protein [Emticicia fontis]